MSLCLICIELRENLRCANVFLKFDQNLLEQNSSLKIDIKDGDLLINEKNECFFFKLSNYFDFDALTLSNLLVESHNASFRLNINHVFERENNHQRNKLEYPIRPLFETGKQSTVHCSNCKCRLFELTCVLRMREFPTGAVDTSEFFCHASADFTNILVPRICDIYYGFQFLVINMELLDTFVKLKLKHLYCHRCLQYLGEALFENKAAKLWTNALLLRHEGTEEFCDVVPKANAPILMQKILDDCSDFNEPLHSMNFAKVILQTTLPTRKRQFLMIHILEKELKVLRNEIISVHCISNNNNAQHQILTEFRSFKLLFRFVEETDAHNAGSTFCALPALLQYWQQDISIQTLSVPFQLFDALLHDLKQNSSLIPKFYRYPKDDFILSFVFY